MVMLATEKGSGASTIHHVHADGQQGGKERVDEGRPRGSHSLVENEYPPQENGVWPPRRGVAFRGAVLALGWEWCGSEHSAVISIARRLLKSNSRARAINLRDARFAPTPCPTELLQPRTRQPLTRLMELKLWTAR